MRYFLVILLLSGLVWADKAWQHYSLDVALTVPTGWKIIQGPVMLQLDPKQPWKGERRPKFGLTWRQSPPGLDQFETEMKAAIRQKGGSLLAARRLKLAGYPALRVRANMPEKGIPVTAEVILIRVDDLAGYLVTTESLGVDTAAADPAFAKILTSLRVGPRPRTRQLKVEND